MELKSNQKTWTHKGATPSQNERRGRGRGRKKNLYVAFSKHILKATFSYKKPYRGKTICVAKIKKKRSKKGREEVRDQCHPVGIQAQPKRKRRRPQP